MARFSQAFIAALLALALGPLANAQAAGPVVAITSPAAGGSTTESAPAFSGTTSDSADQVTVRVYAGAGTSGTLVETVESASPTAGLWSAQAVSRLRNGTYTAVAEQTELGTPEPPGVSEPVTFTIDAPLPAVSLEPLAPAGNDATPMFKGGSTAGDGSVTLVIHKGTSVSGALEKTAVVAPGAGGEWSFTSEVLPDGTYTAIAEQSDELGNTGVSEPTTFTIDTVKPKVTLSAVTTPTRDSTPTFSGSAGTATQTTRDEAAVAVSVYAGSSTSGTLVDSAPATVSGSSWTYTPPALADGTYTVQATQRDEAGNVGASAAHTFTVDTTPPAVSLTPLATLTNNRKPSFGGAAGIASGDIASIKLTIYAGTAATGSPVETVKATPSGASWGATPPTALADGTYTAVAEQADEAGNVGVSGTTTFTVDATPPSVSLNAVASPTKIATPTFTGAGGTAPGDAPTVTVTIYVGAATSGAVFATATPSVDAGTGTWSFMPPSLADGTYTVQATQRDEADNVGTSVARTFTVDTTAPAVSLTPLATVVGSTKPSFGGGAGTASGDIASIKLTVYAGTAPSGSPVETVKATPSGASWAATPPTALADGTYTAIAEQADEAGNVGVSEATTFTVKTKGPAVSLDAVAPWTNDSAPTFSGSVGVEPHALQAVTLEVYPGTEEKGSTPIRTVEALVGGAGWTAGAAQGLAALPDGTYTAVATQLDEAHNEGLSIARSFTVDTKPPTITLSAPGTSSGIETVSGSAGTEAGDRRQVTVELFAGASVEPGNASETIMVNATGGAWSATFASLSPGEYTVLARESDEAGNVGESASSAFTVTAPPPSSPSPAPSAPSPPAASFTWVPTNPAVGQSVSLVSSSTNGSSAIASYAWDLVGNGQFAPGGAVLTTSFTTAGAHLVQLQVTDADGLSSTVAQTITVTVAPPRLMQPFPIVRIAGSETSYGAKVRLLTVQAPIGAKVQVTCVGHGCTTKSESRVAVASSKATVPSGAASLTFKRFERPLRAGVTLQIRVTKAGEIGKFTSFAIRREKLPVRTDACLQPTSSKPSACPSS